MGRRKNLAPNEDTLKVLSTCGELGGRSNYIFVFDSPIIGVKLLHLQPLIIFRP